MLEKIVSTLESEDSLSGWQVREIDKRSSQLYVGLDRVESFRRVDSLAYEIEILVNRRAAAPKKGMVTGSARFTLDPSALGRLDKELDQAMASAALIENEAYAMTEVAGQVPQVPLSDLNLVKDPETVLRQGAEILRQASASEAQARFSAAEFFADSSKSRYFNSQGVQVLQESTLFSGEFVLLSKGKQAESEVFKAFKRRRAEDVDFAALARESAEHGRRLTLAGLPKTGSYDVVFSGEALENFFSWISSSASAASKYNRMTRFELGQELVTTLPGASP
ncbi:MAG: hypothetical protein V4498_08305, partial [candidate division FCPU426 bacterium]